MSMRIILRRIIFSVLYVAYSVLRPFLARAGVPVLMYHSVADDGDFFSISVREFVRQMEYIAKYRRAVPAGEIADFIAGKKILPEGAVVVTFDDGYRNFRTDALPVLKKYRIPSVIFILAGDPDRKELGNAHSLLSLSEIYELSAENMVEIGSHGLTHKKLTRLPPAEAENEIRQSRVLLNKATGKDIRFFAYPKGSFNAQIAGIVENAGYKGVFAVVQRLARPGCDKFAIPRLQIDSTTSFWEFKAKLTLAADWYYMLWKIKNLLKI